MVIPIGQKDLELWVLLIIIANLSILQFWGNFIRWRGLVDRMFGWDIKGRD